ncbi:unnamed protein product, partial [Mesorhabditis spiculigera]
MTNATSCDCAALAAECKLMQYVVVFCVLGLLSVVLISCLWQLTKDITSPFRVADGASVNTNHLTVPTTSRRKQRQQKPEDSSISMN